MISGEAIIEIISIFIGLSLMLLGCKFPTIACQWLVHAVTDWKMNDQAQIEVLKEAKACESEVLDYICWWRHVDIL